MKNIEVRVVWFDQKDGNGIVIDSLGREYYVDASVLSFDPGCLSGRPNALLILDLNDDIHDVRCGRSVRLVA